MKVMKLQIEVVLVGGIRDHANKTKFGIYCLMYYNFEL